MTDTDRALIHVDDDGARSAGLSRNGRSFLTRSSCIDDSSRIGNFLDSPMSRPADSNGPRPPGRSMRL